MNQIMVWIGLGIVLVSGASTFAEMPNVPEGTQPQSTAVVWHENFDTGWQEARRRGIPMLIYITSDRCHYCQAMKRDTWCDQSVLARVAKDFVAIRLSPRDNSHVLNRIDIPAYPMTLIGIPQGKIIDHRVGYQPPARMHELLNKVLRR